MDIQKKKSGLTTKLYIAALVIFVFLLVFITLRYGYSITNLLREPETFRNWLDSFGNGSIPVFIFFQVLQVVVAWIPGEVIQIADNS